MRINKIKKKIIKFIVYFNKQSYVLFFYIILSVCVCLYSTIYLIYSWNFDLLLCMFIDLY